MTELVLFHHAHGLTDGVLSFADTIRSAGHLVHTPDLYDGERFEEMADGVGHAELIGFSTFIERGLIAVEDLPPDVVYAGMSLGVLPAELLALTRPGARGAVLLSGCAAPDELGAPWPQAVPLQIHLMDADEWVVPPNEDLEAARALQAGTEDAELFIYSGDRHLFADVSTAHYDADAAVLLTSRLLEFLGRVG